VRSGGVSGRGRGRGRDFNLLRRVIDTSFEPSLLVGFADGARDAAEGLVVHLRHGLLHAAPAVLFEVDRSTVSGAIRQIRPLLAARGFAVPDRPGVRLRTIEDVFAYAEAEGVELRIYGTDAQVRRPKAGRPGRKAFISGKREQNTVKTTIFSDGQGRTLFSGVAAVAALHRPPPGLRPDPGRDSRPGLRPLSSPRDPPHDEQGTRPRSRRASDDLLITPSRTPQPGLP
jgi:Helix-turn-helix of DDE superfamily endonuclease